MVTKIIDILPRAILVGVAASITVGPVAIMTIQRTLSRGVHAGVHSALGVSSADTFLALISYMFYSLISNELEEYSFPLRIIGGMIVSVIGLSIMLRTNVSNIRRNSKKTPSPWRDYISTVGLTMANFIAVVPYILAFFALFHIKPVDHFMRGELPTTVIVISGFFIGSILWWFAVVFGINRLRNNFRLKHLLVINRVAGGLILLLGLITMLSTIF
ncbi:MAG: LysE family transporter [Rikenellaceae bacterium]